jgi:hypothetical protein
MRLTIAENSMGASVRNIELEKLFAVFGELNLLQAKDATVRPACVRVHGQSTKRSSQ